MPVAEAPKKPPARRKPKQKPAPKVSDKQRAERMADAEGDQAKVLGFVRRNGEITFAEAAELLGCSLDVAKRRLHLIARKSDLKQAKAERSGPGRRPTVYRVNATGATSDDGPKTKVEERVVDVVKNEGPIDEGTLAFNAQLSMTDVRSVATGLKRRGVLASYVDEGVTLWKVA